MSNSYEQTRSRGERALGCLLGGAVGDALGAAVEFLSLDDIRRRFGPNGIGRYQRAYGRLGAITDDTQMTLFTAEGVLRARAAGARDPERIAATIHESLLRWLSTQGFRHSLLQGTAATGLLREAGLHARRAPGGTCLTALRATTRAGRPADNESKGCGAIMRIAPIALGLDEPQAEEVVALSAAHTHGHPLSTAASTTFARLLLAMNRGKTLDEACAEALSRLGSSSAEDEIRCRMLEVLRLAESSRPTSPEAIEALGQGWVAEEALAIALFCALRAESFVHGVHLAVNHGGDSDSTGSLTGQLLGAAMGAAAIPEEFLSQLELRSWIERAAVDLSSPGAVDERWTS